MIFHSELLQRHTAELCKIIIIKNIKTLALTEEKLCYVASCGKASRRIASRRVDDVPIFNCTDFFQVRNNKRTAILAIQSDSKKKNLDPKAKKEKLFTIYRPNTGQAVKLETLSNLRKKFKKVQADEAEPHWNQQFNFSAGKCSHAYW